ncbi:NADH-quinone oxidoreductase subunit F [Dehalogenimonas formicexedens]|uniref:NADH-quinone oxidoreductase subunit F n=1 Tax=Dehalogenimonas formicexedens TaxID=1839801 RepID=A0A1P8F7M5_9CHLR|nr:NADH-quinone oxidoreductase subunit NuoF [Dehalogenimonas formicexedens]APV44479.1 NADH-quinone oxidoreductase subunit F [Dehalogenimonas formicexedens]
MPVTSDFATLQAEAKASWQALIDSPTPHILIGTATCGKVSGAMSVYDAILAALERLGIKATVTQVGCFGMCYAEPTMDIVLPGLPRVSYGFMTPEKAGRIIEDFIINGNPRPDLALCTIGPGLIEGITPFDEMPMLKDQHRIALRNGGHINPLRISHYIARGGYAGLYRALSSMTPQEVIDEVSKSGLRGRGGAGFATGQKWQFCRNAQGSPKYMICNADEGDPGAFMDRSILEGDPHSVIEGLIIAAYAIGASEGFIYVRAEYPLAVSTVRHAVEQARERGFLGTNIMGSGFDFDVRIKEGAGAFVCGEETALMASIEGRRGMPRSRPPFPAQSGLWGKPTTINNVKTLAMVSYILAEGAYRFAGLGTDKSQGTCVFALAGNINHMGLIEVPMGTPLDDVIFKIGGGIPRGRKLKAVQIGGPSGGCLPADLSATGLDYESLIKSGAIMGSGGLIVMDEGNCMVDVARYFLSFIQAESCGKCTPCRLGTKQMLDILTRITKGEGKSEDIPALEELAKQIKVSSLCALGGTSPNPVLTTLKYFRDEYEAHINEKRCPAGVCKTLIKYAIVNDKCNGCRLCEKACPAKAITFVGKRKPVILDETLCNRCGICRDVCKLDAVAVK